jgi:hypothetical protein
MYQIFKVFDAATIDASVLTILRNGEWIEDEYSAYPIGAMINRAKTEAKGPMDLEALSTIHQFRKVDEWFIKHGARDGECILIYDESMS